MRRLRIRPLGEFCSGLESFCVRCWSGAWRIWYQVHKQVILRYQLRGECVFITSDVGLHMSTNDLSSSLDGQKVVSEWMNGQPGRIRISIFLHAWRSGPSFYRILVSISSHSGKKEKLRSKEIRWLGRYSTGAWLFLTSGFLFLPLCSLPSCLAWWRER